MKLHHVLVAVFVAAFIGVVVITFAQPGTLNRGLIDEMNRKAAAKS